MAHGDDIQKMFIAWEPCRAPIDQIFHSAYSKSEFESCLICDKRFIQGAVQRQYLIMKTFVHDEPIIELAVCEKCRLKMSTETSAESKQRVTAFFSAKLRLRGTIEQCAVCDRRRSECRSCTLYAHCIGAEMVTDSYPFMLCDQCEEAAQEMLSDDTRGWQRDFMDQYFGGPDIALDPERVPLLV